MIYIIGSGLSGIAAAVALVKRGFHPTILDAGITADSETASLKEHLSTLEPDQWPDHELAQLKQIGPAAVTGIPRKLHFGSDFAYREPARAVAPQFEQASIVRSFAQGGFSNVWGAVIQRWPEAEFQHWPVNSNELDRHYTQIRKLIQPTNTSPKPSAQVYSLHHDLQRSARALAAEGIRFKYADLAVRSADDEAGKGCRQCGICLYGCPYDSIFSATSHLKRMIADGQIQYLPNVLVDRLTTWRDGTRIEARAVDGSSRYNFRADSVFVATGLLESARIVFNSTELPAIPLRIHQSEIFTIPLVRYHRIPTMPRERLHTLCQMVMEIDDGSICDRSIQLQLYGYNDLYLQILKQRLGPFSRSFEPFLGSITDRILVAFGYLHSNNSSQLWITRSHERAGGVQVKGEVRDDTRIVGRAVVRKLYRIRNYSKAIPIPNQLHFDAPGGGHRSGGCFPMKTNPKTFETDRWGTLPQLPNVHLVDSSVLPSIPAAPLAFTVMANAHRIASECPLNNAD